MPASLSSVLVALAIVLALAMPAGAWTLEEHETEQGASEVLIALDGRGRQHILYEAWGEIFHLTDRSGSWTTRRLVRNTETTCCHVLYDLALTPGGKLYFTYKESRTDAADRYLFAANASGAWESHPAVRPDHLLRVSHGPAIAVWRGTVHISYGTDQPHVYDPASWALWLRSYRTDGSVATKRLRKDLAVYTDVAADPRGALHVVSQGEDGIRYTSDSSGRWRSRIISGSGSNSFPQVALEGRKVHVAWKRCASCTGPSANQVVHATNRSGAWSRTTVAERLGGAVRIAWSRGVHLGWIRGSRTVVGDEVVYATNQGGSWRTKVWAYPRYTETEGWLVDLASVAAFEGRGHVTAAANRHHPPPERNFIHLRVE